MNVKVNITTDSGSDVDQVSRAVATRLKAYRKAKKMSLDELSRRASISKGMLVEMEKEAANPSIAILCKLAAAPGGPARCRADRSRCHNLCRCPQLTRLSAGLASKVTAPNMA